MRVLEEYFWENSDGTYQTEKVLKQIRKFLQCKPIDEVLSIWSINDGFKKELLQHHLSVFCVNENLHVDNLVILYKNKCNRSIGFEVNMRKMTLLEFYVKL